MHPADGCTLLVIDVQDKLFKVAGSPMGMARRLSVLTNCAWEMGAGIIYTEQYPQGLGATVEPLAASLKEAGAPKVEKQSFDCFSAEGFASTLKDLHRVHLVIGGIESHICVEQTANRALELGYKVAVLSDGTQSIDPVQKGFALARMEKKGIEVVTVETVVYRWMGGSDHPSFKKFQKALMDLQK